MGTHFSPNAFARALGFAAGWAGFTVLLAAATRPMRLGPGFSDPLPYAVAAILLSGSGHLIRFWLNQTSLSAAPENPGSLRGFAGAGLRGLRLFFQGTAAFNNFVFLSVAYLLGIGVTSLFLRGRDAKNPGAGSAPEGSYWRDLHAGKREADAYYRPF